MTWLSEEVAANLELHRQWLTDTTTGRRMVVHDDTLQEANLSEANLRGANLRGANLWEANLTGANLSEANLRGANLRGANLARANLTGVNLARANLTGVNLARADLSEANLRGANLARANLWGADLRGARNIISIGPGGSRGAMLNCTRGDKGVMCYTGCFGGTLDAFQEAVIKQHGDNEHGRYYQAVIAFLRVWGGLHG